MQDAGFSLPHRLLFQENYLSRLLCGRTNQSSSPDAKSQKEKDAATNTCLGTYKPRIFTDHAAFSMSRIFR